MSAGLSEIKQSERAAPWVINGTTFAHHPAMTRRLLVPLDGSYASERILPWVVDYARRHRAQVDLLRVAPPAGLTVESEHKAGRDRDDALRYLDGVAEKLWRQGIQTELYVRHGAPVPIIRDAARVRRSDVIFIATRGATSLRRGLAGSTTEHLLRQAPAPMFVAQASREPWSGERVLVYLDSSDDSIGILPHAETFGGELLIAYTRPLKDPLPARIEDMLARRGIRAGFIAISGDPATALTTLARKKQARTIALNGTDARTFSRLFGRPLAEDLIRTGEVPVLVSFHRNRVAEPQPHPA